MNWRKQAKTEYFFTDLCKYYVDWANAKADKCPLSFDNNAKVAHVQMRVEYNAVLVVSGVMFNFDGNKSLNISDNSRQFAQGTTELSQLLINESAKLDITIDIYIVKISFIDFQTYV